MSTPTLILGNNKWAIEEDSILGYAVEDRNGSYLPREISFTRGSDATFTTSTGVIRQACWNFALYSEEFDNAAWSLDGVTISANQIASPTGTTTADLMTSNGTGQQRIFQTYTVVSGSRYTISVYVKQGTTSTIQIVMPYVGAGPTFTFSTATFNTVSGWTSSSQALDNGWYRISATATTSSTLAGFQLVLPSNGSSIYLWGAQFVAGSDALGYLRTTDRLNMPRVDSSTGTKALLLEPQRTNLLLNTVFDGTGSTPTSWSRPGGTGSSLLTTSTLGSGVQACLQSATSQRPFLQQDYTVAINTTYTFSMYIESISGTINYNNVMYLTNLPAGATTAYYLNNNLVDEGSQAQVGRLSIRVTIGAASSLVAVRCGIGTISNSTATILFSRPQFEVGSYPTTYIPTQATTVTRIADSAVKTGISGLIGQTEGVLYCDVNLDVRQSFTYLAIAPNIGAANIYIGIGFNATSIQYEVVNSGVQSQITFFNSSTGRFKIAGAYKENDFVLYVNGSQIGTDTSGTVPTCSEIGLFAYNQNQPMRYNQVALFNTRLTNAELAALTTL